MSANEAPTWAARKRFYDDLSRWGPQASAFPALSRQEAESYCRHLATEHYENFTVVSYLLPRHLRQDFSNIYAYCRWADDLGDELESRDAAMTGLEWWREELESCYAGRGKHPVMVALQHTIESHRIPIQPFLDLLSAFRQDQVQNRYADDEQVIDYCRRSANPVGRILLLLAKVTDPKAQELSDHVCTGLQLANFCQDMKRDAAIDRIYLPISRWPQDMTESTILRGQGHASLQAALALWTQEARRFLLAGLPLTQFGPLWLRRNVRLFIGGGLSILHAIAKSDFDVWTQRLEVTRSTKLRLLAYATVGRIPKHLLGSTSTLASRTVKLSAARTPISSADPLGSSADRQPSAFRQSDGDPTMPLPDTSRSRPNSPGDSAVRVSYAWCEQVARQSHSSFYTSFSLLRPVRRRSMYAYYAFARLVDDLADAPTVPSSSPSPPESPSTIDSHPLQLWRERIERLYDGPTQHARPPLPLDSNWEQLEPALLDSLQRHTIPQSALTDLLDGMLFDLKPSIRIPDRPSMEQYCHWVATSVGQACLAIWGGDPETHQAASRACGLAFQWTNILRDVAEDARRDRIYLPLADLRAYGIDEPTWLALHPNGQWRELLGYHASEAEKYYQTGWSLIEALPSDSQRMFSLMWRSYHRLLERTQSDWNRVWKERVRLTWSDKIWLGLSHQCSPLYAQLRPPLTTSESFASLAEGAKP